MEGIILLYAIQGRAKQLYNTGYKNIQQVAFADPNDLARNIVNMPYRVARDVVAAAKVQCVHLILLF